MNEQLQTIYDFLISINDLYPSMNFKCGYGASKLSYIVEESPKQAYNNGEYAIKELEFAKEFETKYTDDIIIFVEEGDACGIKDCIFTIGGIVESQLFEHIDGMRSVKPPLFKKKKRI